MRANLTPQMDRVRRVKAGEYLVDVYPHVHIATERKFSYISDLVDIAFAAIDAYDAGQLIATRLAQAVEE